MNFQGLALRHDMKVAFWMLLGLVTASSLWVWASPDSLGQPKKTYSEEEYIEYILDKIGWPPASANSSSAFVDGEVYVPIKNFFTMRGENTFGIFSSGGRFNGFHTGVDVEVSPADLDRDVPVHSIYKGTVVSVEQSGGYGGVVTIKHKFGDSQYIATYGHLRLSDIKVSRGERVGSGELIGYLGANYSTETDGERKHLHFGINMSGYQSILGYVDTREELLKVWLDPTLFLKQLRAKEIPN